MPGRHARTPGTPPVIFNCGDNFLPKAKRTSGLAGRRIFRMKPHGTWHPRTAEDTKPYFWAFNCVFNAVSIWLKKPADLGVAVTVESKLTSVGRELCVGTS